MTDDQITRLKYILQQSKTEPVSSELDEKILDASRSLAPQKTSDRNHRWFANGFAFNAIQTMFAIAVTIGLFLLMSRWVTVYENNQIVRQSATLKFESGSAHHSDASEGNKTVAKPTLSDSLPRPRTVQSAQDQILIDYPLPSVDDIVARLNREIGPMQTQHNQALVVALNDIRARITVGDLDDARERYALLRQQCVDCNLPDTLEALVLLESQGLSPPPADTG